MKTLHKIVCFFAGHIWENDDPHTWPVHGYRNEPNDGLYCLRCGIVFHHKDNQGGAL